MGCIITTSPLRAGLGGTPGGTAGKVWAPAIRPAPSRVPDKGRENRQARRKVMRGNWDNDLLKSLDQLRRKPHPAAILDLSLSRCRGINVTGPRRKNAELEP